MLRTPLCDLLEIEYPIIQAGMGSATSAALAAAVSNAGGLGSLGAFYRPPENFRCELETLQSLTNCSFALNDVIPTLNEGTFGAALALAQQQQAGLIHTVYHVIAGNPVLDLAYTIDH